MQATQPFLVYRDRIGAASEVGFLRRQYIGFTRLRPVWTGRTLLPGAPQVGGSLLRLGGGGLAGSAHRLLFRHFGCVPDVGLPNLAPVLHAQFARGGALALPLARGLGLRMVVTLHGGDISKRKNWQGTVLARRWPEVVRETSRFVCVSAAVAEVASARGVPDEKLLVLPIGVEVAETPPQRDPRAHLFVGRFVEKKGIAVLADAMRQLRASGDSTALTCVGDGPLRPLLERLTGEISGVTLTGWLGPDAVRERMLQAVSLIVPSVVADGGDAEGLPSVIPEAMAVGCPVIGSAEGGIAEAIRHERTGLLVSAGDAAGLMDAMHRIGSDAALGTRLGSAGYRHAATELNARIQSTKLESLLVSL